VTAGIKLYDAPAKVRTSAAKGAVKKSDEVERNARERATK
jgi:hypothetical protein